jgi:beclin 1
MSFIMLTESQLVPVNDAQSPTSRRGKSKQKQNGASTEGESYSNQLETATRLFEILSARSDIDHPICVECTERLVEQLQKRLGNASRERDAYVEFLRQANSDIPTDEELHQARYEVDKLRQRETEAMVELKALEAQKAAMQAEILELDAQAHELDIKEEEFWNQRNAYSEELTIFQNEREKINNQYDHDSKQLERLRRANVFNDTFSIGHDGFFGTINGLRLGRLNERPVEWSEINAAWGHTCLLLATVAEKLAFAFKGFDLIPLGSASRIRQYKYARASTNDPAHTPKPKFDTFKLYSTGDAVLNLGFLNRDFDQAMVAFLECLRQLIEHVEKTPFQLPDGTAAVCPPIPYKIEKDRIGESSIKLGISSQSEGWTKACKQTLICCKLLLAHASNVNEVRRRG